MVGNQKENVKPIDSSETKKSVRFAIDQEPEESPEPKGVNETYYIRQTWDVSRFKSPDQNGDISQTFDEITMFNADGSMLFNDNFS